jgi:hypothetical protein
MARTIKKPINIKCSISDSQSIWFIQLPLGLKGLIVVVKNTWHRFIDLLLSLSTWPTVVSD